MPRKQIPCVGYRTSQADDRNTGIDLPDVACTAVELAQQGKQPDGVASDDGREEEKALLNLFCRSSAAQMSCAIEVNRQG